MNWRLVEHGQCMKFEFLIYSLAQQRYGCWPLLKWFDFHHFFLSLSHLVSFSWFYSIVSPPVARTFMYSYVEFICFATHSKEVIECATYTAQQTHWHMYTYSLSLHRQMLILLYSDTNYVLDGFRAEYFISNWWVAIFNEFIHFVSAFFSWAAICLRTGSLRSHFYWNFLFLILVGMTARNRVNVSAINVCAKAIG